MRNEKQLKMSITTLLALSILISAFSARVDSKSLNQNAIRFRRIPSKEFSAALGSSITIECEAASSPPPTIHWLKDGRRISQNEFDENQLSDSPLNIQVDEINRIALSATRSRLYIDCAGEEDEATYTCVAENAFSKISSHTKLNLFVAKEEALELAAAAATAAAGEPLTAAAAAAAAMAAAERLSAPLPGGSAASSNAAPASGAAASATTTTMTTANTLAQAPANGEATGSVAGGQKSLTVESQCLSQRPRARIHMWTHNIVEIMRNDVLLYCRSNLKKPGQLSLAAGPDQQLGLVESGVTWALPDDKLVTSEMRDKYEILETGDLLIKDLRWADMGSYICTVSDDQGSDSVSTFVYPATPTSTKRSVGAGRHQQQLSKLKSPSVVSTRA